MSWRTNSALIVTLQLCRVCVQPCSSQAVSVVWNGVTVCVLPRRRELVDKYLDLLSEFSTPHLFDIDSRCCHQSLLQHCCCHGRAHSFRRSRRVSQCLSRSSTIMSRSATKRSEKHGNQPVFAETDVQQQNEICETTPGVRSFTGYVRCMQMLVTKNAG